ncbi:unnamed protein product [Amoebophrya sp. A25]|nr:unnamed protein product [Amoebophrya sp. A25]|eukprot:GSA25T00001753001.1
MSIAQYFGRGHMVEDLTLDLEALSLLAHQSNAHRADAKSFSPASQVKSSDGSSSRSSLNDAITVGGGIKRIEGNIAVNALNVGIAEVFDDPLSRILSRICGLLFE